MNFSAELLKKLSEAGFSVKQETAFPETAEFCKLTLSGKEFTFAVECERTLQDVADNVESYYDALDESIREAFAQDTAGMEAETDICKQYVLDVLNIINDYREKVMKISEAVADFREGICPVCGEEYEQNGEDTDCGSCGGYYHWECPNCGATGMEGYKREFDGTHEDVRNGNGEKVTFTPPVMDNMIVTVKLSKDQMRHGKCPICLHTPNFGKTGFAWDCPNCGAHGEECV